MEDFLVEFLKVNLEKFPGQSMKRIIKGILGGFFERIQERILMGLLEKSHERNFQKIF